MRSPPHTRWRCRERSFGALALAAFALLVAGSGCGSAGGGARGPGPDFARAEFPAPRWRLRDQHGDAVSSRQLRGKVEVVSFLFPFCRTDCPFEARQLALLQRRLDRSPALGRRIRIVAFNLDPGRAKLADLRAFIREFGGDPGAPSWLFLTGSSAAVRRVVSGGFHVGFERSHGPEFRERRNPLADRRGVEYDVRHQEYVMIVAGGRVRGFFRSGNRVDARQILAAAREAAPRLSAG